MNHAIVHRGRTDTIREFALEVDSWRKIPCFTRYSNPHQYCPWLFSWLLYQPCYTRLLFPLADCRGFSWCWRSSPWWWPGDCWSSECLLPTLSGTCCSAGCSGSSRRFPCWPGRHSDKDTGLHHPACEMMERMFVNLIKTGCAAAWPYWFTVPERFLPFFPGLARCVQKRKWVRVLCVHGMHDVCEGKRRWSPSFGLSLEFVASVLTVQTPGLFCDPQGTMQEQTQLC